MSQTLDNLVEKANKLYWRKSESQDTIYQCKVLLNLLGNFIQSVVQISSDAVPTEPELNKIEEQVATITQKINRFSVETKSPHWNNIVGLILVALGQGLHLILPSLALSETFIRDEHPLTIQAQQLISDGQAALKEDPDQPSTASDKPGIVSEL